MFTAPCTWYGRSAVRGPATLAGLPHAAPLFDAREAPLSQLQPAFGLDRLPPRCTEVLEYEVILPPPVGKEQPAQPLIHLRLVLADQTLRLIIMQPQCTAA
jgi:hypothetical protein